jgi:glycosyltransferase involved in cell wall biosynthesis
MTNPNSNLLLLAAKEREQLTQADALSLSIVVPVFNESEAIPVFLNAMSSQVCSKLLFPIEIVFVNDGSTDNTMEILLAQQSPHKNCTIRILDLSRNFGKEAAMTAGLHTSTGQMIVPMDVDLQDPPELILEMVKKWHEGYDVVLCRRSNRDSDDWIKRCTANLFYKLHNKISEPAIPDNVGDFRLMDRIVVDALDQLVESRRFMKGLFSWAGFKTTTVDYARPIRIVGESKFNGWRLWNFALEGVTSFSIAPLVIWTYAGFMISIFSVSYGLIILVRSLIFGVDVPGYASLLVTMTFLGGIQLMGIGVLGEYLGRTYLESKRRPIYLIRKIYEVGAKRDTEEN